MVQAALAEPAARQAAAERVVAHQSRRKRKVGERAKAEVGVTAGMVSTGHQRVNLPMLMVAVTVVPALYPGVEIVGSSGGPVHGASSQPSIASERPQMSHGMPSSSGSSILYNGRAPNFEAALRWAMK